MKEIIIFEPKNSNPTETKKILAEVKEILNKNGAIYQVYEVNKELTKEEK